MDTGLPMWLPVRWQPVFSIHSSPGHPGSRHLRRAAVSSTLQWIALCFSLLVSLRFVYGEEGIKIQPFHFPNNIKEGQKFQTYCGLIQGNAPVNFVWKKNGETIISNNKLSIVSHPDFSRLVINSADVGSSGNYTCVARNAQGEDSYSAHLAVRGPPKWIREPTDVSTSLGESVTLTCATYGFPPPAVTWRRANESAPDQWSPLVTSRHIRLESNGSLTILIVQNEDAGHYQCQVSNGIGEGLLKIVSLGIKGIPRIQPFSFTKNVTHGHSLKTFCVATGQEPLSFQWQKDGVFVLNSPHIKIQNHDDFSVLTITSVDYNSSGNYTCTAKNSIGSTSYSAVLSVFAPPKWTREPQDSSVGLEGRLTMDCEVRGYPLPRITWTRTDGVERILMKSGGRFHVADNGSLIISQVKADDAGTYECSASNDIGNGLTKTVELSIHVPAKFEQKFSVETVRWGETAILQCEAVGDNPITLTWTKDQIPLSEKDSTRYEVFGSVTERGTTSELHVQVAERDDNGLYVCIAKNTFGKDERTVKLVVLEVPGPPSDVRVEQTWSQSSSVRWTVPYGGNSLITSFVVQYWRDAGAPHRLEEETVVATQTFTMLKDLQPGTSYVVRVLAENEVGRGNPSESQQFLTKEAEPSAPPTDVTVLSRGAGTLQVKWKAPPKDQWNGQLKGYYIGYQVASSSEPYSFKTVEYSKQEEEEYRLTNLQRATEYRVIVQAFNSAGSGPASQDVVTKTSDTDPPSPPFLWVDSQSRSSIGLKWKHKGDAKETAAHYTLYYKDEYGPWNELTIPRSAENQYSLSGLREGTRYQLYLRATSESGESDPSDMLTVRTEGGALSDMSSHPIVEHGEDVPIYFRITVVAPLGASLGIILVVLFGACFYVRREEKRFKAAVAGGQDRRYSYSGSSTLPHPPSQRYVDVDKTRPLLRLPGVPMPPQPPPEGYPAPYATLPLRGSTTDRRRPSEERQGVGREVMLAQNTMDRKRLAGLTIQETAEVHHYDMAA